MKSIILAIMLLIPQYAFAKITWEYNTLHIYPGMSAKGLPVTPKNKENILEKLNYLGQQGWELVGFIQNEMGSATFYFKRKTTTE